MTVRDGDTVHLVITLTKSPDFSPHPEYRNWKIYYSYSFCAVALVTAPYCPLGSLGQGYSIEQEILENQSGPLESLVIEAKWTSGTSQCPGQFRHDVYSPDQTAGYTALSNDPSNPFHWESRAKGTTSPTHLFIPRDGNESEAMHSPSRSQLNKDRPINTTGKWHVSTFQAPKSGIAGQPADVACVVDLTVDVWLTAFFVEPAYSKDWSVFPSA